jgi:hypothetical protein
VSRPALRVLQGGSPASGQGQGGDALPPAVEPWTWDPIGDRWRRPFGSAGRSAAILEQVPAGWKAAVVLGPDRQPRRVGRFGWQYFDTPDEAGEWVRGKLEALGLQVAGHDVPDEVLIGALPEGVAWLPVGGFEASP